MLRVVGIKISRQLGKLIFTQHDRIGYSHLAHVNIEEPVIDRPDKRTTLTELLESLSQLFSPISCNRLALPKSEALFIKLKRVISSEPVSVRHALARGIITMCVCIQRKKLRHGIALATLGKCGDKVIHTVNSPFHIRLVNRPH
ncbi:hypothetical protein PSEWESI4_01725 [Pseudomonas carbonaria]|uniref:Uncharacterized protein n=1 Tax=Zestomonas carbonaria TaxID=2762745 RepID=A0A7U7EMZ4_9GAMM|nr:hypothetical protein PSEWESI4_01725 [Pseudomonas carbonaria]